MPARQQCYGTHGSEVDGHVLAVRVADYHTVTTSSMPSSLSNSLQVSPRLGSGSNLAEGSRPNTTNLIVSSLPRAVDETYLILLFACFGKIIRAKVVRDDTTGISKGTGFVYFENASDAEMARTQMNGYMLEGHMLKVDLAGPPPVTRFSHTSTPVESIKPHKKIDDANIFIRCMPEDVDENYLTLLFSPYGKIIGINLMKDQSGHRNGYGFISFGNASDAAMAITHMNGFKIKGHSL
ncbi:hypothetical protein JCGZ_26125 [Jatropha curcas]|uniref:RRM domain-containing protein n=1 Tax=Jatropha curcas TaxID=180498 RepID=A0A067JRY7_JATCU|nr:hypothetical protein JCGZ_26125 [Jatropha curcas]